MSPDPAFWRGRRVLVTGHTGFKGSWLTLWLERLGAHVTGFALAPDTKPSLFALAASRACDDRRGDVRDAASVRAVIADTRPSVVVHMAAQALVRASYRDPVGTYATNVMGTVHVLDAIRCSGSIDAAIIVTSDKAYENREWPWPYRETDPMGGHDPYSNSKGCAELVTAAYRSSYLSSEGCRVGSARAGNVIGGGDWSCDRLIPDLVRGFREDRSVAIRSPGAVRPWQHVLEPLSGYLRLAERLVGPDGETFADGWNFGPSNEDSWPVSTVADHLARGWGGGAWHQAGGEHPHEAVVLKVDSTKARARLGWTPRLRLAEALDWTVWWYREQALGASAAALTGEQIALYEKRQPER